MRHGDVIPLYMTSAGRVLETLNGILESAVWGHDGATDAPQVENGIARPRPEWFPLVCSVLIFNVTSVPAKKDVFTYTSQRIAVVEPN